MSDLSPQSGPKRTLIQVAVTNRDALDCAATPPQRAASRLGWAGRARKSRGGLRDDCEHEQNGLHVIAHPSEKHGVYPLSLYRAALRYMGGDDQSKS